MLKYNLKESAYNFCENFIESRLARIHKNIDSIQDSLSSETKSSAGDKHETGRAMLQLEREKLGQQLADAEKTKNLLSKVDITKNYEKIGLGSWVQTSGANYFIAISAGEFKNSETSAYCVSIDTPIGQMLKGKSVGDAVVFNGTKSRIEKVE